MDNDYKKLDPSVIVSAVCQKCADCCRGRFYVPAPNKDQEDFHRAIMGSMKGVFLNPGIEKLGDIKVVRGNIACSKLLKDGKTFSCGIYDKRPNVCRNFNCFDKSNAAKKHPGNLEKIQRLVKQELGKSVFEEDNKK